jgi:hypothetical protein
MLWSIQYNRRGPLAFHYANLCHILHSVRHWPVLVYFINRRGTAQARHLHVTVSQGLGGPTAQVAFMAPHFCIIRSSQ